MAFNLAESYIWPTSLPAVLLAKWSGDKGQWEVVSCGNATTLHWEPKTFRHGAHSGEHLEGSGDPGGVLHFVLKLFGISTSCRACEGATDKLPLLLTHKTITVTSVVPDLSCTLRIHIFSCSHIFFKKELQGESRGCGVRKWRVQEPGVTSMTFFLFWQKRKYLSNKYLLNDESLHRH